MQIATAEKKARALMDAHGLKEWDFAFDRATRRLGATHVNLHRITLSRRFVKANKWEEVLETVLHEIAHAITGDGHTKRWKQTYVKLGGNPNRSYANLVSAPRRPIVTGHCPNCKRTVRRRIRNNIACYVCCNAFNHGRYSVEYKIIWEK